MPLALTGDLPDIKGTFVNRVLVSAVATATVKGGVYAIDTLQAAVDSQSGQSYARKNVALSSTTNLRSMHAVALGAYAPGVAGLYQLQGECDILVLGTTDVAIDAMLIPADGVTCLVNQSTSVLVPAIARALEANTTDTTPQLIKCYFKFDGFAQNAAN